MKTMQYNHLTLLKDVPQRYLDRLWLLESLVGISNDEARLEQILLWVQADCLGISKWNN